MKTQYPNIPSLKTLEIFATVAKFNSLSRAADELCITTSAVSLQIKRLENDLDKTLFSRLGRGIALTPVGKDYYHEIRPVLESLDAKFAYLHRLMSDKDITVQTYVMASIRWLNMRLLNFKGFQDDSYKLKIITPDDSHFNFQAADMAFILEREPSTIDSVFQWQKIFPHEITPFCSSELLASLNLGSELTPNDISKLPIICTTTDTDDWKRWFATFCPEEEFKPFMTVGDKMMAIELALNHQGIVLMNSAFIYREIRKGDLHRPFDCTLHLGEWGVIYLRDSHKSELINDVINHISGE